MHRKADGREITLLSILPTHALYCRGAAVQHHSAARRMVPCSVIALLSLSMFATSMAEAAENRPFWTEQALFHFGDDVFFTGRASCAPNVEEGRQRAYLAAVQEVKISPAPVRSAGFRWIPKWCSKIHILPTARQDWSRCGGCCAPLKAHSNLSQDIPLQAGSRIFLQFLRRSQPSEI